jgi:predicted peptidase
MKPAPPRPGQQTVQVFSRARPRALRMRYLLFLPQGYDPKAAKRWPAILFLHGSEERGSDPTLVLKHGPPKVVLERPDLPFIVVSPQCPARKVWVAEDLLALMSHVAAKYKVDRQRIHATGISMGGYAAWELAIRHPKRFAAVVPISGGGDILPIYMAEEPEEKALRELNVWAFHGGHDDLVPVAESERMVHALRHAGADKVRLTVHPNTGHDAWTQTYDDPKLYEWLLEQKR